MVYDIFVLSRLCDVSSLFRCVLGEDEEQKKKDTILHIYYNATSG